MPFAPKPLFPNATSGFDKIPGLKPHTACTYIPIGQTLEQWITEQALTYLATEIYNIARYNKSFPPNCEASKAANNFLKDISTAFNPHNTEAENGWQSDMCSYDKLSFERAMQTLKGRFKTNPEAFNRWFSGHLANYMGQYPCHGITVYTVGCNVTMQQLKEIAINNSHLFGLLLENETIKELFTPEWQTPILWELLHKAKEGQDTTKALSTLIKHNPHLAEAINICKETPVIFCIKHNLPRTLQILVTPPNVNIIAALQGNLDIKPNAPIYDAINNGLFEIIAARIFETTDPIMAINFTKTNVDQLTSQVDTLDCFQHPIWKPLKEALKTHIPLEGARKRKARHREPLYEAEVRLDELLTFYPNDDYEVDHNAVEQFCNGCLTIISIQQQVPAHTQTRHG